jgi:hypothetical protein
MPKGNLLQIHFYIVDQEQSFGKSLKRLLNARGLDEENRVLTTQDRGYRSLVITKR